MSAPILVAVQSPVARTDMGEALAHAGYQVFASADGLMALQLARATEMRLVIADAGLPRFGDGSLFKILRRMPEYCFTPFVLFTDGPEVPHPNDDPSVSISAWLFSPLDRDHLVETVSCFVD